jgi:hypothetical protein
MNIRASQRVVIHTYAILALAFVVAIFVRPKSVMSQPPLQWTLHMNSVCEPIDDASRPAQCKDVVCQFQPNLDMSFKIWAISYDACSFEEGSNCQDETNAASQTCSYFYTFDGEGCDGEPLSFNHIYVADCM